MQNTLIYNLKTFFIIFRDINVRRSSINTIRALPFSNADGSISIPDSTDSQQEMTIVPSVVRSTAMIEIYYTHETRGGSCIREAAAKAINISK